VIRAEIYNRDTGARVVAFHEGTRYEIFSERDCWEPTLARWAAQGISVHAEDEDGLPGIRWVRMTDPDWGPCVKDYIERQFKGWHVEVCGTDMLGIARDELRGGKYTRCYADITPEELGGLLWLLGEWAVRADSDHPRARAARKALLDFDHEPLTLEDVKALMRGADRGDR